MASEDVLERAFCSHRTIARETEDAGTVEHLGHPLRMVRDVWSCCDCGVRFVPADSSAAEVRELRKDKARLEWVLANCMFKRRIDPMLPDWAEGDGHWIDKQIVTAMGATEND